MGTPLDRMLNSLDWKSLPTPEDDRDLRDFVPHATHCGILRIGDAELRVYQLSNGQRVIQEEDLERFFGGIEWRKILAGEM